VTVPAGRHRVRAAFTDTPVRAWSNAITIASGVVALITLGWSWPGRIRKALT
jgi:hypothetical protein